ncbi:hypothetical protein FA95DRAFT_1460952, partial [Auriscalpium vulgare]
EAYEKMSACDFGEKWHRLVGIYFSFEISRNFEVRSPLLSFRYRPDEIGLWIQNARNWKRASVKDATAFAKSWWRWWVSMQPAGRVVDSEAFVLDPPKDDMDWGRLNIAGINGFLSVVAALTWWGIAAHESTADIPRWSEAVVEVTEVL